MFKLHSKHKEKLDELTENKVLEILDELSEGKYIVDEIKEGSKISIHHHLFTTSTLQQEAYKKLNFQTKRTMSVAQSLYEGVEVKGYGVVGLITYMRTDSVRLSADSLNQANEFVAKVYGDKYKLDIPRQYGKNNKNIQDAHEAIRPTNVEITPDIAKQTLKDDQYKLYSLIWRRFLASQMRNAVYNTMAISIKMEIIYLN